MTNNIKAIENRFVTQLGSGKGAATSLLELALHAAKNRDTTVFTNIIDRAKRKGDDHAARIVLGVMTALFPGVDYDKKENTAKIKGIVHNQEVLRNMATCAEKGISIRGSTYKKDVIGIAKKDYVLSDAAKAFMKSAVKNGYEPSAVIAAIQAAGADYEKKAA